MKGGVLSVVSFAVMLCMVLMTARQAQAAISCGQVTGTLSPCLSYLTGSGNASPQCCSGVKQLQSMASTQGDRRSACNCLKSAATRYTNLKPDRASSLPSRCGVSFSFTVTPSTDCNTIP